MDRLCDNDLFEILNSFSQHNMEPTSLVQLIESIGWGDVVTKPIVRTATSYATICCETGYEFSSEDYSWLESAIGICEVQVDRQRHVVAVDLDCDSDNFYLICAALVKVLNHVKAGDCLFLFKLVDGIAFGSKRSFGNLSTSDFCISCFIPNDLDYYKIDESIEEFLLSLKVAEWDEIPMLIMESSPQENSERLILYDHARFDLEYISSLQEISAIYGIDTSHQVNEYYNSFDENHAHIDITYKDAVLLLKQIGIERSSSYDILNAANEAEAMSNQFHLNDDDEAETQLSNAVDRIVQQYSEEAFENAELLLKEMLKRDT